MPVRKRHPSSFQRSPAPEVRRALSPFKTAYRYSAAKFRRLSKRPFPHTSGDRGRRSAGRAPRDGGNAPHSRSFQFKLLLDSGARFCVATVFNVGGNKAAHIYRRTMEGDGAGSYFGCNRTAPHPPTPRLSVWRDLRSPSPDVSRKSQSLRLRTPGA
jgi:hypothetical protein